jgi:predicted ATPase
MAITELRIEGLRTIEKLRLKLNGLTVLIGENGSGKSSIIEACELLRRATSTHFMNEFYSIHGGLQALLRQGAPHLKLGITVRPEERVAPWHSVIEYDLTLQPSGSFARLHEQVRYKLRDKSVRVKPRGMRGAVRGSRSQGQRRASHSSEWVHADREDVIGEWDDEFGRSMRGSDITLLSRVPLLIRGSDNENALQHIASTLDGIEVHLPFEVVSAWAGRALDRKTALRAPSPITRANKLEKLGLNLASAFHSLKNSYSEAEWQRTLGYIRLGLGEHIEDVATVADPSGGSIGLALKFKNRDQQVPASQISDGMLAYLAFVALFRLRTGQTSLLAFDEPDLHMNPRLLMRVLDMFESMARDFPVLVATHSDRLLDGLSDPARSVVLCELNEDHATQLFRPDSRALSKWLERYRGLGDLRGAGHAASVLTRREPA